MRLQVAWLRLTKRILEVRAGFAQSSWTKINTFYNWRILNLTIQKSSWSYFTDDFKLSCTDFFFWKTFPCRIKGAFSISIRYQSAKYVGPTEISDEIQSWVFGAKGSANDLKTGKMKKADFFCDLIFWFTNEHTRGNVKLLWFHPFSQRIRSWVVQRSDTYVLFSYNILQKYKAKWRRAVYLVLFARQRYANLTTWIGHGYVATSQLIFCYFFIRNRRVQRV